MATTKTIIPKTTNKAEPDPNELGIDQAVILGETVGEFVSHIASIDDNQDGKITMAEILNKVQILGLKLITVFSTLKIRVAIAQLKDADSAEFALVREAFAKKFDLRNDEAEFLIEDWIAHLEQSIRLFSRTKTILTRKSELPVG